MEVVHHGIMSERWSKIFLRIMRQSRKAGDCLIWTGATSGNGRGGNYPRMSIDGETFAVHRVMWALFNGPLPRRRHLDHTCRNRLCIQPDHLELVTQSENEKRKPPDAGGRFGRNRSRNPGRNRGVALQQTKERTV